jgi:hypothetical protein
MRPLAPVVRGNHHPLQPKIQTGWIKRKHPAYNNNFETKTLFPPLNKKIVVFYYVSVDYKAGKIKIFPNNFGKLLDIFQASGLTGE